MTLYVGVAIVCSRSAVVDTCAHNFIVLCPIHMH